MSWTTLTQGNPYFLAGIPPAFIQWMIYYINEFRSNYLPKVDVTRPTSRYFEKHHRLRVDVFMTMIIVEITSSVSSNKQVYKLLLESTLPKHIEDMTWTISVSLARVSPGHSTVRGWQFRAPTRIWIYAMTALLNPNESYILVLIWRHRDSSKSRHSPAN